MGMVVRTNTMSINAYRQLGMNNSAVSKSLEKLSSGFRINRAGDDASGLAISEKMKAQIAGLEQASANAQDGISLIQTAEGATTEIHNMLNRMVTLATKSANGTIQNEVDRENIQTEVNALKTEITRIAKSTNFNGINLLDGNLSAKGASGLAGIPEVKGVTLADTAAVKGVYTGGAFTTLTTTNANPTWSFTYQVNGTTKTQEIAFELDPNAANAATGLKAADGTTYASTGAGLPTDAQQYAAVLAELNKSEMAEHFTITGSASGIIFTAKEGGSNGAKVILDTTIAAGGTSINHATTETTAAADAYQSHNFVAGDIGKVFTIGGQKFAFSNAADVKDFEHNVNVIQVATDNAVVADDVEKMANLIEKQTGYRPTINSTATQLDFKAAEGSAKNGGLTLQVGDTNADFNHVTVSIDDLTANGLGISGLDVSTQSAAGASIDTIKAAINQVSTNRGTLGALQNRLEYTINNLDTTNENMTAANSRIRDTDMAKEMMNYTKMNILTQAAQAMLAQANQQPQSILQLLQ